MALKETKEVKEKPVKETKTTKEVKEKPVKEVKVAKETKTIKVAKEKPAKEVKVAKETKTTKVAKEKPAKEVKVAKETKTTKEVKTTTTKKPVKETKKTKEVKKVVKIGKATVNSYELLVRPILSERSMKLMETENKITVEVKKDANKIAIKNAFESVFGVKVKKVNTSNVRAKSRKVGQHSGLRPSYKKAIITLEEGQALDLFKK